VTEAFMKTNKFLILILATALSLGSVDHVYAYTISVPNMTVQHDDAAHPDDAEAEPCEDDDLTDDDGCNCHCLTESDCGNGEVEAGEFCDPGVDYTTVGIPEEGKGPGVCGEDCQSYTEIDCGNGTMEAGEECDDGNTADGDGCDPDCKIQSVCGNDIQESDEECDDGNTVDEDGCSSGCVIECPTTTNLDISCSVGAPPVSSGTADPGAAAGATKVSCSLSESLPSGMSANWTPSTSPSTDCTATVTSSTNSTADIDVSFTEGSDAESCNLTVSATVPSTPSCTVTVNTYTQSVENNDNNNDECESYTNCNDPCDGHTEQVCGAANDQWDNDDGVCTCPADKCETAVCEE
jgi:cysteine-rich repeat protein